MKVSFKQYEYTVRESDGRVAITIDADRRYFYESFNVKIRAFVNRDINHYGTYLFTFVSIHMSFVCIQLIL